jgi:tRNA A37 threonylcarbamoyladenosine dehydratase
MRERITRINPGCVVHAVDDFAGPDNWPQILPAGVTAVIDACDEVKAKVAMAAWALRTRTPFIACGAAGGKRLAHRVDIDDLANTTHDPLLAQLRYRLRKFHDAPREGKRIGVACVFSREAVAPPDPSCNIDAGGDGSLNCHGYGSVVSVTATFGQCAAGWLLDQVASKKRPSRAL